MTRGVRRTGFRCFWLIASTDSSSRSARQPNAGLFGLIRCAALLCSALLWLLAGCAAAPATTPVIFDSAPVTAAPERPPRAATPEVPPPPEPEAPAPRALTVIVSYGNPFHLEIARHIVAEAEAETTLLDLNALDDHAAPLHNSRTAKNSTTVIIGEAAIRAVGAATGDRIEVLGLTPSHHRSVPAIPSIDAQLETWSTHFPEARRIGMVASARFQPLADAFTSAAARAGLTLEFRSAENDLAAEIEFRRLTSSVDGLLILPDPAILTPQLIRNVIEHGKRNGLRLLGYNDFLLDMGVDLVLTLDAVAVAREVLALIANPALRAIEMTTFSVSTPVSRQVVSVGD